jgi:Uncharacterised nucleotidyltransferase
MLEARSPIPLQFATPSQLLLLRAALLECPEAVEAAEEWFASGRDAAEPGFSWLEQGSRRLLPLVYRNVKEALPPELRETLRRVSLQYWADNQKLFRRLEERLTWFHANGIPTVVLKGAALSVLHYRDKGIRPMSDVDILVPEDVAGDVIGRLQRDGWAAADYCSEAPQNSYFYRHIHAISLIHPDHGEFDLHWHVLHAATFPGADSAFWDDSVPLSLNTIATRALNPTDQLLHVCVHCFTATGVAPIRWIADALTILRTSQMDWGRLVRSAEHLRVSIPLAATLSFLRDTFPTAIPGDVLGQLASIRADASERRYFARLSKFDRTGPEIFAENWERHRRANRDLPPVLRLASLPRQFQLHYNLPRLTDLGPFAFSLLGKRIAKMVGRR